MNNPANFVFFTLAFSSQNTPPIKQGEKLVIGSHTVDILVSLKYEVDGRMHTLHSGEVESKDGVVRVHVEFVGETLYSTHLIQEREDGCPFLDFECIHDYMLLS